MQKFTPTKMKRKENKKGMWVIASTRCLGFVNEA